MNNKINLVKIQVGLVSLIGLILYYILYLNASDLSNLDAKKGIYVLSVMGIVEIGYIIKSWKMITGEYLTLYTLFMTFFFLFNYGQSLLWALGIHSEGEIGSVNLYYYLPVPSAVEIFKTQLIVLVSGLMINFGAIVLKKVKKKTCSRTPSKYRISAEQRILYDFSRLIAPVIIFSEYFKLLSNFKNAQTFGYTALYYNPEVESVNVLFHILSRLFLPVLLGLLIGSGYNKKIQRHVYVLFVIDIIISLLIGDRGGWIYSLCVLAISHHLFNKKIKGKQFGFALLFVLLLSYISAAVVEIRNSGVTIDKVISVLTNLEENPIVSTISTMGSTMGVTLALVMSGGGIFPYGNSFLYGILISPTKDLIEILDLNFQSLGSWFSQGYLGISNGAGFSIVAETLLNYGPLLLPLFMFLFGIFIYCITNIEYKNIDTEVTKIIFCLITTAVTINISRNPFSYNMGEILYTTIQYFVYFEIYKAFVRRNKYNNKRTLSGWKQ